jgi:hypothetical protein
MVVMPAKPVVEMTQAKSAVEASLDPWARFCTNVEGGGTESLSMRLLLVAWW